MHLTYLYSKFNHGNYWIIFCWSQSYFSIQICFFVFGYILENKKEQTFQFVTMSFSISAIFQYIILQINYLPSYFIYDKLPRKHFGHIFFYYCVYAQDFQSLLKNYYGVHRASSNQCQSLSLDLVFDFIFYYSWFILTNTILQKLVEQELELLTHLFQLHQLQVLYIGFLQRNEMSVMLVFTIFSIISFASLMLLKQTKGKILKIEEILQGLHKANKHHQIQIKQKLYFKLKSVVLLINPLMPPECVRPTTYYQLVQKVGTDGKYQFHLMLIFIVKWFVTGIILLSNAFLFLNRSFNCQDRGFLSGDCQKQVCRLPKQEWLSYIQQTEFKSLASQFGNYFCEDAVYLDLTSSATYLGAFIGFWVISFYSDNFGRRRTLLVSWTISVVGMLILIFSVNLYMTAIGLFLLGLGSDAAVNISFSFFGEVVEDKKRQGYSVLVMSAFCSGALIQTICYIYIPNWQIVTILCLLIPAVIQLLLIYFYVQETPKFLIRMGVQETLRAMNRIGRINLGKDNIIEKEDIENVMKLQLIINKKQRLVTPLDLFIFPSLRTTTICLIIIFLAVNSLYYGPIIIVGDIGFDIYTSNIILNLSDLFSYLPNYFILNRLPRKYTGIALYIIAGVCSTILIFVSKPQHCQFCKESIIEIVLIFIFRFCVSFYFALAYVYVGELYPLQASSIGLGACCAFGTITLIVSPIYLGYFQRNDINVMIVFTIYIILSIASFTILNETLGKPLRQEIQQIAIEKDIIRSSIKYSTIAKKGVIQSQSSEARLQ